MINFFIVGCPRSGTTLLSKILTTHKDIFIPDETGFLYYLFGMHKKLNSKSVVKHEKQIFQNNAVKNVNYSNLDEFTNEFRSHYLTNEKLFGEKTPRHWYYLDIINLHYENSKVFFMLRNPISVVNSYKKHKQKWFPFYNASKYFHMDIFFPMFVWKDSLKNYKLFTNDKYMLIKYEDLIEDEVFVLKKISYFLELKYDNKILDFYKTNNSVSKVVARNKNDKNAHLNLMKPINKERMYSNEELTENELLLIYKYLEKDIIEQYPNIKLKHNNTFKFKYVYYFYYFISLLVFNIKFISNNFKRRILG
jgi:hypothetical protein